MRLIDADAVKEKYPVSQSACGVVFNAVVPKIIDSEPTVPAILIPENATNGDVLKRLLYGKAIITEFIHDVNISVNNTVVGQFDREWWNAPYKRGEME